MAPAFEDPERFVTETLPPFSTVIAAVWPVELPPAPPPPPPLKTPPAPGPPFPATTEA